MNQVEEVPCHIIAQALHGWLSSGAEGVVANGAAGGAESRLSHARVQGTQPEPA